jgi:hypothetical protein
VKDRTRQTDHSVESTVKVVWQSAIVNPVQGNLQAVGSQVPPGLGKHRLRNVGSDDLTSQGVKQVQIPARATGAVQYATDTVLLKESVEEVKHYRVVFGKFPMEEVVSLRKTLVWIL